MLTGSGGGSVSYPRVPDIRNPGRVDREIPLPSQVAHNEQEGGEVVILQNNQIRRFAATEGSVLEIIFPFGASEQSGRTIEFRLDGTDPDAQLIYKIEAMR